MASTLLSPGVLARENDSSQVRQQPVVVGAAIIGPTPKGPVEIPTVVTSYSDYVSKFGDVESITSASITTAYSYFTGTAVYNYFLNGGQSMLVTRVVTGSYTAATSTAISASTQAASQPAFVLETLSKGTIMNSTSPEISGSLTSGSKDNLRWEIVSPNTASGTFTLLIRQGNDQSPNNKTVIEQFTNLSLDPFADNYIANVVGDYTYNYATDNGTAYLQLSGSYPNASRYVRVKSVNLTTPNYLNSYGAVSLAAYTASIPLAASGSFGGATGTTLTSSAFYENITNTNSQGLTAGCYSNAIALLANKDDYQYNVLLTPGLINNFSSHVSSQTSIISNTLNRGDALYVMDLVEYGSTVATVTGKAASQDTSYAAAYWPWVQVQDPATGKNIWVPASTMIGGVYAYNDRVAEPWFAPAGINRGGLSTVIRAERKLAQSDRDTLYQNKVNPIATFPGQGVVVYGQKTLQAKPSALDRVNVRRLLIALKSYISQVANNLIFEQNTTATRNAFLAQVNPYLASVQQRQGLYAFKVVMDDTNNTPDVIDRNQLVGQIYLQPTKTAEFIYLDFNITPTGVAFA
jgi:phage tail sheath protein FI